MPSRSSWLGAEAVKLLLIHADRFWWRVREAARGLRVRDEPEPAEAELADVVVAFTCVEEGDGARLREVVAKAADAIAEFAGRMGCEKVLLYPYAHLSTRLARPEVAMAALRELQAVLVARGLVVTKSPFGYYKEFMLHCKGHPLSEAFRDIGRATS